MAYPIDQLSLDDIISRLDGQPVPGMDLPCIDDNTLMQAAILILLIRDQEEWHLLLTRRTNAVRDHKGQVSFPGGAKEPSDSSIEMTALRETKEEIGLDPQNIRLITKFPSVSTISNYCITPCIGTTFWPQDIIPEEVEVDRVFTIPLHWLMERENWEYKTFQIPGSLEERRTVIYKPYDGEILWGISAQLTHMLLDKIKNQPL
jgi:8-oxo-dGTP pyrophosphatase MutT (NUDIX family)